MNPITGASARPARGLPSLLTGCAYALLGGGLWWLAHYGATLASHPAVEQAKTVTLIFDDMKGDTPDAGGGKGGTGTIDPALKAEVEKEETLSPESLEKIPNVLPQEDRSLLGLVNPALPMAPGGDGLDAGRGGGLGGGNGSGNGSGNGGGSMFRSIAGGESAIHVKNLVRLHQEIPDYPKAAKKLMVEGAVIVRFTIDEQGVPIKVAIVSGHELLRTVTLEAAWKWRFEPVRFEGKPVQATFEISFGYVIQRT